MNKKRQITSFVIKTIKTSILTFFIFASTGITYTLAKAVGENYVVDQLIESFIARADENADLTFEYGGYQWRYYPIQRTHDYELSDARDVFYDEDKREIGQFGDILLNRQNAFRDIPIIYQFISFYFGGHAAFRDDGAGLYETTGLNVDWEAFIGAIKSPGYNSDITQAAIQHINFNYWLDMGTGTQFAPFYRSEMMSVRVKDVTNEQLNLAKQYLDYQVDNRSLYNFLFWLDMKEKHYCTDLVSRAYQYAFYDSEDQRQYSRALNDDGFITSVNDLILAEATYFTTYTRVNQTDLTVSIYYLADL